MKRSMSTAALYGACAASSAPEAKDVRVSVTPSAQIITPEAVVLEFRSAGLATRSMAKLIDVAALLVLASLTILILAFGASALGLGLTSDGLGIAVVSIGVFVLVLGIPAIAETIGNGSTPGKAIMGLRVVTTEGGPISFRHALLRGLVQLVEIPTGIAVVVALANPRSQRLGDFAAGTFVISERAASSHTIPTAFYPPHGCDAYCAVLDVARIDSEQFLLIRNLLLRLYEMGPDARASLSTRLAHEVALVCTPPPPVGLPAELYLVCVCSAYQMRHGGLPHWSQITRGRTVAR